MLPLETAAKVVIGGSVCTAGTSLDASADAPHLGEWPRWDWQLVFSSQRIHDPPDAPAVVEHVAGRQDIVELCSSDEASEGWVGTTFAVAVDVAVMTCSCCVSCVVMRCYYKTATAPI